MRTTFKLITASLLAAIFIALPAQTVAQPASEQHGSGAQASRNVYNYVQLLRSEANSEMVRRISEILNLSEADAKKFWPIYREYENELGKRTLISAEFAQDLVRFYEDRTTPQAQLNEREKEMAVRWFTNQRARLDLLEKYHGRVAQALSPLQAGQFVQIEHQLSLFVDMTIAAEVPSLRPAMK